MGKSALDGIRVVDCTVQLAGPGASGLLALLGADVIHIEEKGVGDTCRGVQKMYGTSLMLPGGRELMFEELNANKKSLAVDLRKQKGKEIIYRLVGKSDVFLTNMRAETVKRFGVDSDTIYKYNPKIIYASSSGFGTKGPDANAPALDLSVMARSSVMWTSGEEGMPPVLPTTGLNDKVVPLATAFGILVALLTRERTGIAQEVSTSGLASLMYLSSIVINPQLFGREVPRYTRTNAQNPIWNYYKCKDGEWISLACWWEHLWPNFCRDIGHPELEKDPKFLSLEMRAKNNRELISFLDKMFATKTAREWVNILKQDPDLIFGKVNTVKDLMSDPQVLENGYICDWQHSTLGPTKWVAFPVKLSKTPAELREPAPELGQHTEEILAGLCGYSWDEIGTLRNEGVI